MLGEEFPIEIQDKILTVLSSGANVLGQCYVDSIVLSSQAVHGTEYHEAFHRIVELLLPSKVRDKIYKLYPLWLFSNKEKASINKAWFFCGTSLPTVTIFFEVKLFVDKHSTSIGLVINLI